MTEKLRNPRGRPRTFDREVALRTVMDVFWQYGYEGTSISKLLAATGLKATSLYAAFGDKETLFQEAVKLYIECEGAYVWGSMTQASSVREAMRHMLKRAAGTLCEKATSRGCLLLLGDKGLSPDNAAIKAFLMKVRDDFRTQVKDKVVEGIKRGDLSAETNIEASVAMVMIFLNGISIEVADYQDLQFVATLNEAIDGLMDFWPIIRNV